ncbi:MAG: VCBS repeat-containing protein [Acidobacteriota bacterium]
MSRYVVLGLVGLVAGLLEIVGPAPVLATGESEPTTAQPPPARSLDGDGLQALAAHLPGEALDVAPLPESLGGGLGVLTADGRDVADERPTLWRIDSDGAVTRLADDLPERSVSLLAAADAHSLWLAAEEGLYRLAPSASAGADGPRATARRVLAADELVPAALRALPVALAGTEPPTTSDSLPFAVPGVGSLRIVDLGDDSARTLASAPLPVDARRSRHGLYLSSPAVTPLDRSTWIAGPEPVGQDRLRLHRLHLEPGGDVLSEVFWARLPGPETLRAGSVLLVNGEPAVIALTTQGGMVDLFEKLSLRVFPLRPDRTGAGTGPILRTDTATRRWYRPDVAADDVDGDGDDDLVVVQPLGLDADELRIDVYRGRGGVAFDGRAWSATLDLPSAAWSWGDDFDGDGTPDLAAVAEGRLRLFRGVADGRRPLERRPWRELELPAMDRSAELRLEQERDVDGGEPPPVRFAGRPRAIDLDRDGRMELVLRAPVAECPPTLCAEPTRRSSLVVIVRVDGPSY